MVVAVLIYSYEIDSELNQNKLINVSSVVSLALC